MQNIICEKNITFLLIFDQNVINFNKLPIYIIPMDFYSEDLEIFLFLMITYKENYSNFINTISESQVFYMENNNIDELAF